MENHNHVALRDMSFKPEPIIISELGVNTEVRGWLLAQEVQNRTAKNGKQYRQLKLRDQKGNEITARQFDLPQRESNLPQAGKVVLIEGLVEEFQKRERWKTLNGQDIATLYNELATLPNGQEPEDPTAKFFDLLMLKLQLATLQSDPSAHSSAPSNTRCAQAMENARLCLASIKFKILCHPA